MANPFGADSIAAGYASFRPAVHPRVLECIAAELEWPERWPCALDVGCGAGVSTQALSAYAARCIGVEPAQTMLKWASANAPHAEFAAGAAEALPVRDRSIDLITAAGSLNYADLDRFFPEAARVLRPRGMLVVYDFGPGKSFRDHAGLENWFDTFMERYPAPPNEARELSPEILSRWESGFHLSHQKCFEVALPLNRDFYIEYMMTETNIAAVLRTGTAAAGIRAWCEETLAPVWTGEDREVVFRGYFACLSPA